LEWKERRLLWEYGSGETPQALLAEEARRNAHEPLAPGTEINRICSKKPANPNLQKKGTLVIMGAVCFK
jgi:hypothetical protein